MGKPKSAVHAVGAPSRATPLELAPLLKPYRKHGKLSLRVERVHQLARLSRGRNNGDGSWSLGTDELEDLEYLSPEGSDTGQTLAIRIIGVDQDLATLAVLEFPLAPGSRRSKHSQDNFADGGGEAQRQLEEIEGLRTTLAERVAELAELQGSLQRAQTETARQISTAVQAARAEWKAEQEQHTPTRSASERNESQDSWRTEKTALLNDAKEREDKRVAEARERWAREADHAKGEAEKAWKAGEAARLAKAEADWRTRSAKTLADMQVRLELSEAALAEARSKADAALTTSDRDGRKLLEEMASVRAALSAREDELVKMRLAGEEAQTRHERDAANSRTEAEAAWKSAEAARFAKAESEWREKSAQALGEIKSRCERAEAALAEERTAGTAKSGRLEAEHRQLAEEIKIVRGTLADRESELARTRSSAQESAAAARVDADERKRLTQELADIRVKLAEREAEVVRARSAAQESATATAKADADERRRMAQELADTRATLAAREADLMRARSSAHDGSPATATKDAEERKRIARQLAEVQTALEEREAELARVRATADNSQPRGKDVDAAIAKAKAEWKDAERARLAKAEAEWRSESEAALKAATARSETAERALARAKIEADRGMGDAIVQGLHDEIAGLRRGLADRESELAQIRAKEPRIVTPQRIMLQEDRGWTTPEAAEPPRRSRSLLLVLQIGVIITLVVTGILVGPNIENYIPESVWNMFGYTRLPERPIATAPPVAAPAQPSEQAAPEAEALPTATVARDANVHASPATSADVVTTVKRGAKIAVMGQHGNWIQIRVDDGEKSQDGWVYTTFLTDLPQAVPLPTDAIHQKSAR